jgi:ribosomal RNA small subunit methyltransferase A
MAQTKHQIQSLLTEADARPRQQLGQNFMIDGNLVRIVAEAGQAKPEDLIIEVGPGTGTLTEELLATQAKILAVEIDTSLAELLQARFATRENFALILGDALATKHELNEQLLAAIQSAKTAGKTVRLIANLPYNIASPLIIELLIAGVDVLAFTVQREVADRMRAHPHSREYGTLSIMVQLLSRVEVLRTLPKQAFWPMPKTRLRPRSPDAREPTGPAGRRIRKIRPANLLIPPKDTPQCPHQDRPRCRTPAHANRNQPAIPPRGFIPGGLHQAVRSAELSLDYSEASDIRASLRPPRQLPASRPRKTGE